MFVVIALSVLVGVALTLLVQYFLLHSWFLTLPVTGPPSKPQTEQYVLPKELRDALSDAHLSDKKEPCVALNLIFQFLFRELKDTKRLRDWVQGRMNIEFAEMLQTTTGKLLDTIVTRDFNLGRTFPVIRSAAVQNVSTRDSGLIDEVTLLVDLTYNGGFQLAVDVDLVFGKSAFLSVTITKLEGKARLQFTRIPYTHWNFSFIEEPVMEFDVESQFEGRPIPQITSLIINQIRRSVRKKHTLPAYKIRYKPFFRKPDPPTSPPEVTVRGRKVQEGSLMVVVKRCSRLVALPPDTLLYCTLAVDTLPWVELMSSRRKLWVAQDVELVKIAGQNIGLTFREEFILDRYEELVLVETIHVGTPADRSDIRKNDVVVSVGGVKVNSMKQARRLIQQAGERFTVRIERSSSLNKGSAPGGLGANHRAHSVPDFKVQEEAVIINSQSTGNFADILKATTSSDERENSCDVTTRDEEEYVNITITPVEGSSSVTSASAATQNRSSALPVSATSSRSTFSLLGSSTAGLFQRKKGTRPEVSHSATSSPEMKRKMESSNDRKFASSDTNKGSEVKVTAPPEVKVTAAEGTEVQGEVKVNDNVKSTKSSEKKEANGVPSFLDDLHPPEDLESEAFDLKKTHFVKASQDPFFDEKFSFDIGTDDNYLNICVWAKVPEKMDKQNRVVKVEKDLLLGHLSLSLTNICLDCLATSQGDVQQTFPLTPADSRGGAARSKSGPSSLPLSTHPGFLASLCNGDVTLHFQHEQPLSPSEREAVNRQRHAYEAGGSQDAPARPRTSVLAEGQHDFVSTHFQTATYCTFCGKKIWLKTAFRCTVCRLVCHKKCTERCQQATICSRDGFKRRETPPPGNPVSEATKPREEGSAGDNGTMATTAPKEKTSFLNRFRNRGDKASSSSSSPSRPARPLEIPSVLAQRRNSASEAEGAGDSGGEGGRAGRFLAAVSSSMPRTRSSTSLKDLLKESKPPPQPIAPASQPASSDSESDDEMNLLKYWEQQKSSAGNSADELVVTAAKEMGKELFASLDPTERREKLDSTISKMQQEIDQESEHRAELARLEKSIPDGRQRALIRAKIDKSDDKIQSLAVLMLHYCSGLQHCLDQDTDRADDNQSAASYQPDSSIQSQTGLDLDQSEATILPLNQSEASFLRPDNSTENLEAEENPNSFLADSDTSSEYSDSPRYDSRDEFGDCIEKDLSPAPTPEQQQGSPQSHTEEHLSDAEEAEECADLSLPSVNPSQSIIQDTSDDAVDNPASLPDPTAQQPAVDDGCEAAVVEAAQGNPESKANGQKEGRMITKTLSY